MARLRAAGWHPGRRVDITRAVDALEADGHQVGPEVRRFLAEYDGLEVTEKPRRRLFRREQHLRRIAFHAATETGGVDAEWARAYEDVVGCRLAPVGDSSHLTIYDGTGRKFYGGFDQAFELLGGDVAEVVAAILLEDPPRRLDLVVDGDDGST
jgi:hypothetical protein